MSNHIYLDTSCAVRLFFKEPGSAKQAAELAKLTGIVFHSSQLLLLEMDSVFRSKEKGGLETLAKIQKLRIAFNQFSTGVILHPLSDSLIQDARLTIQNTKVSGRVRSIDCVHFATFLSIRIAIPSMILYSTDDTLCALAREAKAPYFNPLES